MARHLGKLAWKNFLASIASAWQISAPWYSGSLKDMRIDTISSWCEWITSWHCFTHLLPVWKDETRCNQLEVLFKAYQSLHDDCAKGCLHLFGLWFMDSCVIFLRLKISSLAVIVLSSLCYCHVEIVVASSETLPTTRKSCPLRKHKNSSFSVQYFGLRGHERDGHGVHDRRFRIMSPWSILICGEQILNMRLNVAMDTASALIIY